MNIDEFKNNYDEIDKTKLNIYISNYVKNTFLKIYNLDVNKLSLNLYMKYVEYDNKISKNNNALDEYIITEYPSDIENYELC